VQSLTSDALVVTKSEIESENWNANYDKFIHDLTGLEAFVNLDSLSISQTIVGGATIDVENCPFVLTVSLYSSDSKIKLYPNPVSDILYFDTIDNIEKVILFDVLGRKIIEQKSVKNISVSDLQKGSYILYKLQH